MQSRKGIERTLQALWEQREGREDYYTDLVNILQIVLWGEQNTIGERQLNTYSRIINDILSKEVTKEDMREALRLMREVGIHPWAGLYGE